MVLHHSGDYADGYELLVLRDSEKANMMMDFASLSLKEGAIWRSNSKDERALLLAEGSVEIMVGEKVEWIGAGEGRTPGPLPGLGRVACGKRNANPRLARQLSRREPRRSAPARGNRCRGQGTLGTGLALYHRHGQRDTLRAPALPSI
jgi:hypothetical protein